MNRSGDEPGSSQNEPGSSQNEPGSSQNEPGSSDDDRMNRFPEFRDAALQAEFETGAREETVAEARSSVIVRLSRMGLGAVVLIVGIIMLPLPGPGMVVVAAGLAILSRDVAWADRLLRYIRKNIPGVPEDGKIPRSSLVTMAFVSGAALLASTWWFYIR